MEKGNKIVIYFYGSITLICLKKNKNMVRKIVNFREFTLSFLPKDCKFKLVGLNNHEQHDYTSAILT